MIVLHVGEYVKGGVATYINELLKFQTNCAEIEKVFLLISSEKSEKNFHIDIQDIIYYEYNRSIKFIPSALFKIKKCIEKINPDIIHCHSSFAGFFVRFLCLFFKKRAKIVYSPHCWSFMMKVSFIKKIIFSLIERVLTSCTDLIINSSLLEYETAKKYHIPAHKCKLIYNGLSYPAKEYSKNDCPIIMDDKDINLLFIGRFDQQKGIDILLDIYNYQQFENQKLYLIGDSVIGNLEVKIPNGVTKIGWVEYDKLDIYLQMCDAVIIPSRWEGFGLIALDAFRNKKPVIASFCGAFPEMVKNDVNGYLFDINKQDELVRILCGLNKDKLIEMGMQGYKLFEQRYTADIMNKHLLREYLDLLH